jgi:hypothetical protein
VGGDEVQGFDQRVGAAGRCGPLISQPVHRGFRRGQGVDDGAQRCDAEVVEVPADPGQAGGRGAGADAELHLRVHRVVGRVPVRVQVVLQPPGGLGEPGRVLGDGVFDEDLFGVLDQVGGEVVGEPPERGERGPDMLPVNQPGIEHPPEQWAAGRGFPTIRVVLRQQFAGGFDPGAGFAG